LKSAAKRVLIVDDSAIFRRLVSRMLQTAPEIQLVGEVADGLEAVFQASELQPDLILLDVGLPSLSGIEAARRIVQLSPKSKILFLSQESSVDVVRAALSAGASGYVVKLDATRELLPAVHAILRGEQFIGNRFAIFDLPKGALFASARRDAVFDFHSPESAKSGSQHAAQFYSDDESLLDAFARFVRAALDRGDAALVVMTPTHRSSLRSRLLDLGINIESAMKEGRYVSLDAAATLSMFMLNDMPEPVQFLRTTGDLIQSVAVSSPTRRVSACGECARLLWEEGKTDAAIQLEQLWTEIGGLYALNVLCAYRLDSFQGGIGSHIFERICALHSTVHS
jgi:DNA-binding response OmpR family regulator